MELCGASDTTAMNPAMSSEERDYIHLLQQDQRMTKSPRCLTWEHFSDCGKEVSYSFRKLVDSGRSKLKRKHLHIFAPVFALFYVPTAALLRHEASKSSKEADMIASLATTPKSILYYA